VIRAVIIDCYGTLYPDPVLAYRHDGKTPDHTVAALQDIHDRAASGQIDKAMYIERASRLLGLTPEDTERKFFGGGQRNRELLDYLTGLRPQHKLAVLTNAGQGVLDLLFTPEERLAFFDLVVESYAVKTPKPDPAIFQWTCQQLAVGPDEAVMIDDRAENIAAAQAIGMHGVRYYDVTQVKQEVEALLAPQHMAL
jgi:HAD superfamily hydrolase (TIGR01509 family)